MQWIQRAACGHPCIPAGTQPGSFPTISPRFQWDLLKEKREFQDSQVQHFLLYVPLLKIQIFLARQEWLLLSLHCIFVLWENGFRWRRQFPARSDHCIILSCSIFFHLLCPPSVPWAPCYSLGWFWALWKYRNTAGIRQVARDQPRAVQREWSIDVWLYYHMFQFPSLFPAPLSQNRVSYYLQAAAYLCQHLQSGLTLLILHWLRADTVPFCAVITSGISHTNTQSGAAWRYVHLQDWCSSCVKLIPVPSMAVRLHALLILLEFSSDEAKYTFCLCFLCISNTWYFMLDLSIDSILLKLSN